MCALAWLSAVVASAACSTTGTRGGDQPGTAASDSPRDDDVTGQAGPTDRARLHPVEPVPRSEFGHVGPFR